MPNIAQTARLGAGRDTHSLPNRTGSAKNENCVGCDMARGTDTCTHGAEGALPWAPYHDETAILGAPCMGVCQQGGNARGVIWDVDQRGPALHHQLAAQLVLRGDVDGHHAVHGDGPALPQLVLPCILELHALYGTPGAMMPTVVLQVTVTMKWGVPAGLALAATHVLAHCTRAPTN